MSNLWFLWFLQDCDENSWKAGLALTLTKTAKSRKFDGQFGL
ncbi:hypothetical protein OSCI_4070007 [Kamptonema sp. PCC 6506]|nr:hypothetical protein OSCI_4070007 [Kamptonema sp. PCC 6506]